MDVSNENLLNEICLEAVNKHGYALKHVMNPPLNTPKDTLVSLVGLSAIVGVSYALGVLLHDYLPESQLLKIGSGRY